MSAKVNFILEDLLNNSLACSSSCKTCIGSPTNCLTCNSGDFPYFSNGKCEANHPLIQGMINTVADVSNVGAIVISMASSADSSGIIYGSLHKLLGYIRYFNIKYSVRLEDLLKEKKSDPAFVRFLPSIPQGVAEELVAKPIHPIFIHRGISPKFLGNFWKMSLFSTFG